MRRPRRSRCVPSTTSPASASRRANWPRPSAASARTSASSTVPTTAKPSPTAGRAASTTTPRAKTGTGNRASGSTRWSRTCCTRSACRSKPGRRRPSGGRSRSTNTGPAGRPAGFFMRQRKCRGVSSGGKRGCGGACLDRDQIWPRLFLCNSPILPRRLPFMQR